MRNFFCTLVATLCLSGNAQAQLSDVRDLANDVLGSGRQLMGERFEQRTGGDRDFINILRESLRGTYDAVREVDKVDCRPVAGSTNTLTGAALATAIKDCQVAKEEAKNELVSRAAHTWQHGKPGYGIAEFILKLRSDYRRYQRLDDDDTALYPDDVANAWPGPIPSYDPDAVAQAPTVDPRTIEAMQAELQRQAQIIAAAQSMLAQRGIQLQPTRAPKQLELLGPEKRARQNSLRQPGGNR